MSNALVLVAPLNGPIVPLEATCDPVFAGRVMGDGVAIEPLSATLLAPCDATVTLVHKCAHAVTLTAEGGAELPVRANRCSV